MTKYFFLADFMSMIAFRLSFRLRSIALLILFASGVDAFGQTACDCPAAASCNTCSGGFTQVILRYQGTLDVAVVISDGGGILFQDALVFQGYPDIVLRGKLPNGNFQGSSIDIVVNGLQQGAILNQCDKAYPGTVAGSFVVVSIQSKNGGLVCCKPGTADSQPPTIGTLQDITQSLSATECSKVISWNVPTATDNCSVSSLTPDHAPGEVFPRGQTTVTYTATDPQGNSATKSFKVTLNDIEPPSFGSTKPADILAKAGANCQASATWVAPTFTDACGVNPDPPNFKPGDLFPLGSTKVKYTASDASGNKTTCEFYVTVVDEMPPEILNCPGDITVTADNSCQAIVSWTDPSAKDNCSSAKLSAPSHDKKTPFAFGETVVTYTATDDAGNAGQGCSFKVTVTNPKDPQIIDCPANITTNSPKGDSVVVTWKEPSAIVQCGDTTKTRSHIPGSKFPIGKTTVKYTFTDQTGRSSTCSFDVMVLEPNVLFSISPAVTPDGDGINDVWTLPNIENFKNNTVVILDRWGNKIYEANGYDNEGIVWRGTNKSGTVVPTGTYFYTIEVRDQGKVTLKKGFIEVVQ